jgi:hypothetical protein
MPAVLTELSLLTGLSDLIPGLTYLDFRKKNLLLL